MNDKLAALIAAFGDASFECGEYSTNDSAEPYSEVLERSRAARRALEEAIQQAVDAARADNVRKVT